MFIVFDAHNKPHAKNYVQGTLLDRFVECMLSARKSGLAVRQAMKQAMQKCDDMYSRLPTVLTDDRFGSGVGVCAVCLNMGTLTTANLGACRAVICNSTTGEELSRDHVAADVEEAKRVAAASSVTAFQGRTGDDGMLYATVGGREYSCPITRSIGNVQLKNIGLIACRPEVSTRELTRNDKFLIIASPGLSVYFIILCLFKLLFMYRYYMLD